MKNKNIILTVLAVLCLVLVLGVGYTVLNDKKQKTPSADRKKETEEDNLSSDVVTVDGKKYRLNTDIQTILFMGIDKEAKAEINNSPGENGQSDSLNLLILNNAEKTAKILQISRDSMVDIDIYGVAGDKLMTEPGQIALQYAYGDGEERSCLLTAEKVSDLLYGIRVNSYCSLTLEGMVRATDAIGGITLTVPEDYTAIDSAFSKGAVVELNGELAEKYVRTRDINVLDSNVQRMERQSQFMNALIEKLRSIEDKNQYVSIYQDMEQYMVTDLTVDEIMKLSEYCLLYTSDAADE